MSANDALKQYLDAGLEFTELTRKRAEKIVKDLVKAGEVQREHTQQRVDELIERSRQASLAFADAVRNEVTRQLTDLGLIDAPKKSPASSAPSAATTTKTAAKKAASSAKTAASKSTATVKAAAKQSANTAKTAANKSTGAAKTTAKKATGAAKTTAKKAASAAKKATGS